MPRVQRLGVLAFALVASAGAALPAFAQNALGDGSALDRNLQHGSGGKNTRVQDIGAMIQRQNAIVSGRAAGGLSFRGDSPVAATDAFRGSLGSDDLFAFQRDAAFSALPAAGIRYSDALQSGYNATVGQASPGGLGATMFVERPGAGVSSSMIRGGGVSFDAQAPAPSWGNFDPTGRSQADNRARLGIAPVLIYQGDPRRDDAFNIAASPLAGVRRSSITPVERVGFGTESQGLGAVPDTGLGTDGQPAGTETQDPFTGLGAQPEPERPRPPTAAAPTNVNLRFEDAQAGRVEPRIQTQVHQQLLQNLHQTFVPSQQTTQGEETETTGQAGVTQIDSLRDRLEAEYRRLRELEQQGDQESTGLAQEEQQRIRERLERMRENMQEAGEGGMDGTFDALRRSAMTLDSLVSPTDPVANAQYKQFMTEGQRALAEANYFRAEEWFSRAIRTIPGDPLAAAGLVNSQIGAGLYVSAAATLRQQFILNPELVPVRFDAALLPDPERLAQIEQQLRDRVRGAESQPMMARDAALLLAYLGYQTGDTAQVREALTAYGTAARRAGSPDETFLNLLRGVWLGEEGPEGARPAGPGSGGSPSGN